MRYELMLSKYVFAQYNFFFPLVSISYIYTVVNTVGQNAKIISNRNTANRY